MSEEKTTTQIIEKLKSMLDTHEIRYEYNPLKPEIIRARFEQDGKGFEILLTAENDKINFCLKFPFRVQCPAIPLVALYIAEFNRKMALSTLRLDVENGKLTAEYGTVCKTPEHFHEEEMWLYISSLLKEGVLTYTDLDNLHVGKVKKELRNWYRPVLVKAVKMLAGEDEEDEEEEMEYGVKKLRERTGYSVLFDDISLPEFFPENEEKEVKKPEKNISDRVLDMVRNGDFVRLGGVPSFEEFMAAREKERKRAAEKENKNENSKETESVIEQMNIAETSADAKPEKPERE